MTRNAKIQSRGRELLEAARLLDPVDYDVDAGLRRHYRLRSDAPPRDGNWDASSRLIRSPAISPIVGKVLIACALVAVIAGAGWLASKVMSTSKGERSLRTGRAASAEAARSSDPVVPRVVPAPVATPELAQESGLPSPATRARTSARRRDQGDWRLANAERSAARSEEARETPAEIVLEPKSGAAVPKTIETDSNLLEMRELAAAEGLLTGDPEGALSLVRQSDKRFPTGYFRLERGYVTIMALIKLGRVAEARSAAERFLRSYPRSPYAPRIRRALELGK